MRFRKRPVVIEAVELTWANWSEGCEFAGVGNLTDGKPEGVTKNTATGEEFEVTARVSQSPRWRA